MTKNLENKRGQVVAEYMMILTIVFVMLAATKFKVNANGQLDLTGGEGSKTVMEYLSTAFTSWMQDILVIISLPS